MTTMIRLKHIVPLLLVPLMLAAPVWAADEYPTRPVTSLGPFGAGGGADTLLRALATVIEPHLGQPMVHVNKPGGASTVAAAAVATGKPDGYTVVSLVSPGAVPEIYKYFREVPYTSQNLRPVMRLATFPYAFYAHADSGWKTFGDFVAAAKAKSGQLSYAHAGRGHVYHLTITAIARKAGFELRDIPTGGAGPAMKQVLGKHVDAAIGSTGSTKKYVEAGTITLLGVQHKERISWAPDVPTFAEMGYDLGIAPWYLAMYVHADTPDHIVNKLRESFTAALQDERVVEVMDKVGILTNEWAGPETVLADMERDRSALAGMLKDLGFWKD